MNKRPGPREKRRAPQPHRQPPPEPRAPRPDPPYDGRCPSGHLLDYADQPCEECGRESAANRGKLAISGS